MIKLFRIWLARRRCQHDFDHGQLINMGMGKMFICSKCGGAKFV